MRCEVQDAPGGNGIVGDNYAVSTEEGEQAHRTGGRGCWLPACGQVGAGADLQSQERGHRLGQWGSNFLKEGGKFRSKMFT